MDTRDKSWYQRIHFFSAMLTRCCCLVLIHFDWLESKILLCYLRCRRRCSRSIWQLCNRIVVADHYVETTSQQDWFQCWDEFSSLWLFVFLDLWPLLVILEDWKVVLQHLECDILSVQALPCCQVCLTISNAPNLLRQLWRALISLWSWLCLVCTSQNILCKEMCTLMLLNQQSRQELTSFFQEDMLVTILFAWEIAMWSCTS